MHRLLANRGASAVKMDFMVAAEGQKEVGPCVRKEVTAHAGALSVGMFNAVTWPCQVQPQWQAGGGTHGVWATGGQLPTRECSVVEANGAHRAPNGASLCPPVQPHHEVGSPCSQACVRHTSRQLTCQDAVGWLGKVQMSSHASTMPAHCMPERVLVDGVARCDGAEQRPGVEIALAQLRWHVA